MIEKPERQVNDREGWQLALGFAACFTWLVVAVGAVHLWVSTVGLVAAVIIWHFADVRLDRVSSRLPLALVGLVTFAAFAIVQIIPVPADLHAYLQPHLHAAVDAGRRALFGADAHGSQWLFLSADPAATADRAVRWLALIAIGGAAAAFVRCQYGWEWILWSILASGWCEFAVGVAQVVFDTQSIAFVYVPDAEITPFTTFVSSNHAAVYYGLVALCGCGLLARTDFRRHFARWILAALSTGLFFAASVYYFSYGATVALAISTLLFVSFVVVRPKGSERAGNVWLYTVGGAWLLTAVGGLVASYLPYFPRWKNTSAEVRMELHRGAFRAIEVSPWLGHGAGVTEYALPAFIDWTAVPPSRIPTIENELLQWFMEFGIPVGLFGLVLLATGFVILGRRIGRSVRLRYSLGFAIAVYIALNALFHFPFFTVGISAPATAVITAALASSDENSFVLPVGRWIGWIPAVVVAAGLGCTVASRALEPSLPSNDADWESVESQFHSLLRRMPTDGNLYIRAATIRSASGDGEAAIRLVDRAFEIEPKPNVAAYRAMVYARQGHTEKAVGYFRDVFSGAYPQVPPEWVRRWLVPVIDNPQRLGQILEKASKRHWGAAFNDIVNRHGESRAVEFALEIQELYPSNYWPYDRLVDGYLELEQPLLAEMWARRLIAEEVVGPYGEKPTGYGLLARTLASSGRDRAGFEAAVDGVLATQGSPRASRFVLTRLPNDPSSEGERVVEAVELATRLVCEKRGELDWADRLCLRGRGWQYEWEDRREPAEHYYGRLAEEIRDPSSLGRYYRRQKLCGKLAELMHQWRMRVGKDSDTVRKLQKWSDGCRDKPE